MMQDAGQDEHLSQSHTDSYASCCASLPGLLEKTRSHEQVTALCIWPRCNLVEILGDHKHMLIAFGLPRNLRG